MVRPWTHLASPLGPGSQDGRGFELADISNAMVRLYKEQFGRPTKASTHYAGRDILVATLEHSLTPAEHNMAAMGEVQRLRELRMFFQHAERGPVQDGDRGHHRAQGP